MAKLVDAPDLGSGVLRRVGSSPITRTMRQKRNSQKKRVPLFLRIDNASSKRSREAPRQWYRVGCEKQALSILLSKSTMRAAIGHAKHRRMWGRVGCEKQALSITANKIDNASSNRSREAPRQWCRVGCEKRVLSIKESTILAAIGRRMRGVVTPCGLRLASVVNFTIRIDNADSGWSNEVRAKLVPFGPR